MQHIVHLGFPALHWVMTGMPSLLWYGFFSGLLTSCCLGWYRLVQHEVIQPYLDEFFHVRQAQVYCSGDFQTWDPKITTPPGLYLLSYAVYRLTGRCDIAELRALNSFLPAMVVLLCSIVLSQISKAQPARIRVMQSNRRLHRSINIALFPPLFFFSALYYTDVASTVSVLLNFTIFMHSSSSFLGILGYILSGLIALSFRQTNIFWVGIFPLALSVISTLHHERSKGSIREKSAPTGGDSLVRAFYDPIIQDAVTEDYIKTAISLALNAIQRVPSILAATWPSIVLLASFAGFVVVNGGVVLGDKSNHVASLHLPQMLYIWPYILFFSWPVVLPTFSSFVLVSNWQTALRRILTIGAFTAVALAAVHFNTIIHPFTLADNRHYVFYVFRILRVYPVLKYLATPIYIVAAWSIIGTLGENGPRTPSMDASKSTRAVQVKPGDLPRTSLVIAWLATTTLNLVTAPLVEPRYCILPWIFWRLYVPQGRDAGSKTGKAGKQQKSSSRSGIRGIVQSETTQLWLETISFLVINAVTGYVFLHKRFAWPQEPGKIQRFMW